MLMVSSHIVMTKAILGIARAANQVPTATVTIYHDVAVRGDPEDTEDEVVVIVVAQGDILEMLGSTEDSPGGVDRGVTDR